MSQPTSRTLPDIVQTVVLKAPIDKVWKAVSTAEGIGEWFMPNTFEPVVGHEFHLDAGPYGKSPCKVTVFDPPNRLSFNWGKDWTLTFELEAEGDSTKFTLIHGGWSEDLATEFGQPHSVVRETMSEGWTGIGTRLKQVVEA